MRIGLQIIKVNPKYTSQKCSRCGSIHAENRKTQEHFKCIECGFKLNADTNAAINIIHSALAEGVSVEMFSLEKSKKQECISKFERDLEIKLE